VTQPLDGPWAKSRRGREHLDAFTALYIASAERTGPPSVGFRHEIDLQRQRLVIRVDSVPDVPEAWMLLIEDAARNFRSALDHLIWELRFVDSDGVDLGENDRSQFPIASTPHEFDERVATWLRDVTQHHVAAIRRLQPYARRNPEDIDWHPLRLLNALDNDAKHRLLHVGVTAPSVMKIAFAEFGHDCRRDNSRSVVGNKVAGRVLTPGAIVAACPLIIQGPNPQLEVMLNAACYIGFGNGIPVKEGLESIERRVVEILNAFTPELSSPHALSVWRPRPSRVDHMRVYRRTTGPRFTEHFGRPVL
jgi:hypothetical protein